MDPMVIVALSIALAGFVFGSSAYTEARKLKERVERLENRES